MDGEPEYDTYPMTYLVWSPNISKTLLYHTYDKMLEGLKKYENLSPVDGNVGVIHIEYRKNGKIIKGFNEDTQEVE